MADHEEALAARAAGRLQMAAELRKSAALISDNTGRSDLLKSARQWEEMTAKLVAMTKAK